MTHATTILLYLVNLDSEKVPAYGIDHDGHVDGNQRQPRRNQIRRNMGEI
jgi:hypothetical protein